MWIGWCLWICGAYAASFMPSLQEAHLTEGLSPVKAALSSEVVPDEMTLHSVGNQNPIPKSLSIRGGTQEIALIVSELGFYPNVIMVTKDIPIKLYVTGTSKKPLCFMLDELNIQRQVSVLQIEEIEFTLKNTGKFKFYCPIDGIHGEFLVKDYPQRSIDFL